MFLDSVEQSETIVVTRAGRRIASIALASTATGAALNAALTRWRGPAAFDGDFAESIGTARAAASIGDNSDPRTG